MEREEVNDSHDFIRPRRDGAGLVTPLFSLRENAIAKEPALR
jgi:hypothetical protein